MPVVTRSAYAAAAPVADPGSATNDDASICQYEGFDDDFLLDSDDDGLVDEEMRDVIRRRLEDSNDEEEDSDDDADLLPGRNNNDNLLPNDINDPAEMDDSDDDDGGDDEDDADLLPDYYYNDNDDNDDNLLPYDSNVDDEDDDAMDLLIQGDPLGDNLRSEVAETMRFHNNQGGMCDVCFEGKAAPDLCVLPQCQAECHLSNTICKVCIRGCFSPINCESSTFPTCPFCRKEISLNEYLFIFSSHFLP